MDEEHIQQSIIDGIKPTPYFIKQGDSVLLNKGQAMTLKKTLREIRKRFITTKLEILTVNIDTLSIKDIYQGTINNKKCYMERREVTVDPYGNVAPCPFFNNYFLGIFYRHGIFRHVGLSFRPCVQRRGVYIIQ